MLARRQCLKTRTVRAFRARCAQMILRPVGIGEVKSWPADERFCLARSQRIRAGLEGLDLASSTAIV